MRRYEGALKKKARWENHHLFSMRCRDEGVIPNSLKIKPLVKTRKGYGIASRASRSFLCARIRLSYVNKTELAIECKQLRIKMAEVLTEKDLRMVEQFCRSSAERVYVKTKERQVMKLEKLVKQKRDVRTRAACDQKRSVVNLTEHILTDEQESVLELGLNFVPAPTRLPLIETISGIEEAAKRISNDEANDLRGRVCGAIRKAKLPKDNLSANQRRALLELKMWSYYQLTRVEQLY